MKKIVLFCASGMSTSLLVTKMRTAAEEMGFNCTIDAYSITDLSDKSKGADFVLLGPQIKYNLKKTKSQLPNIPVEVIDMVAYGMIDGKSVIKRVMTVLEEN